MKRISIIIIFLLFLTGVTIFAQSMDMAYFTEEYNRPGITFVSRLEVLQAVRDANLTGIGEFYHDALRVLLLRLPDTGTMEERLAADASARILAQGIAAEMYIDAAPELWLLVQNFDVVRDINDGLVMQDALIALGQIGARDFVPHITLRLDNLNTDHTSDAETRRRVQRGVVGAINALETLQDPMGFRPVFFASIGWYDLAVRVIASAALPNIMEDPAEIVIRIIRDPSNNPRVKYEVWREMLRTRAPNSSKALVAAAALETGWTFLTSNIEFQRDLRNMRLSAIDTIRVMGVADDSVYVNLERSYRNSFVTVVPDYDEIRRTVGALSASGSDQAIDLLLGFLRELHDRRRLGLWGPRERQVMQMVIPALGSSGTQSVLVRQLLTTIQRSGDYTSVEQGWARDALRELEQ
jgi:hypothetical protein